MVKRGGNMRSNVATGFGLGIGLHLSFIIFLMIGMLLFIPGLILWTREKKKPKNERNQTTIFLAFGLMILGCIIGMGLGGGFLFSQLGEMDF